MKTWHAGMGLAIIMAGAACFAGDSGAAPRKAGESAPVESANKTAANLTPSDDPVPGASESEDMQLPGISKPRAGETAGLEKPRQQFPQKYWSAYFGERPKKFLIDPQSLLDTTEHKTRLGFLNDHSGDSSVDLFVYLFKGDQDIPDQARAEGLIERFFTQGRPAVVVFYFMGAPQRSVIHPSPSVLEHVPPIEQRHALESSVLKALEKQGDDDQFEAFLVQISIRVNWMEQMMGGSSAFDRQASLAEHKAKIQEKKKHGLLAHLEPVIEKIRPFAIPSAAIVGVIVAALGILTLVRRRTIYRFPEIDVEPRLGGAHAAGVGAVISFASSTLPPAAQREQAPDSLRRE